MWVLDATFRNVTDEWEPIRRIGTPKITDAGPGLLSLEITLSETPPSEWREPFSQFENGIERTTFMFGHNPSLVSDTISVSRVREQDVALWFQLIDAKIAGANSHYADQTLPALAAAEERQVAEDRRHSEAQARANDIAERYTKP